MLLDDMWVVVRGAFHPLGLRQVVNYAAADFLQACAPALLNGHLSTLTATTPPKVRACLALPRYGASLG